jgi:kynurenine formamidase
MPEHLGTHIDAPNHFEKNQPDVRRFRPGSSSDRAW